MTTSTPHILTLPRELRDLVYDHLVQDVNFQYKWSDHGYKYDSDKIYDVDDPDIARALTYPKLSSDIAVYLHEASPPNALLTHFRFNDELKNRSLSNRSATIRIKQQRGWKFPLPLPTRLSGVSVNDALFEVRHITILVCGGSRLDDGRENWIYLEKLIKKLTHKMPHLTTIRVAQRSNVDVFVMSPEQLATCKLFTKPPEQVSGFSLAQRTETYRMPSGPWPSIIQWDIVPTKSRTRPRTAQQSTSGHLSRSWKYGQELWLKYRGFHTSSKSGGRSEDLRSRRHGSENRVAREKASLCSQGLAHY
jgi:hypothetical protein